MKWLFMKRERQRKSLLERSCKWFPYLGFKLNCMQINDLILAPTVFLKFEQQIIFSQDMRSFLILVAKILEF